eukprot:gene10344-7237_t
MMMDLCWSKEIRGVDLIGLQVVHVSRRLLPHTPTIKVILLFLFLFYVLLGGALVLYADASRVSHPILTLSCQGDAQQQTPTKTPPHTDSLSEPRGWLICPEGARTDSPPLSPRTCRQQLELCKALLVESVRDGERLRQENEKLQAALQQATARDHTHRKGKKRSNAQRQRRHSTARCGSSSSASTSQLRVNEDAVDIISPIATSSKVHATRFRSSSRPPFSRRRRSVRCPGGENPNSMERDSTANGKHEEMQVSKPPVEYAMRTQRKSSYLTTATNSLQESFERDPGPTISGSSASTRLTTAGDSSGSTTLAVSAPALQRKRRYADHHSSSSNSSNTNNDGRRNGSKQGKRVMTRHKDPMRMLQAQVGPHQPRMQRDKPSNGATDPVPPLPSRDQDKLCSYPSSRDASTAAAAKKQSRLKRLSRGYKQKKKTESRTRESTPSRAEAPSACREDLFQAYNCGLDMWSWIQPDSYTESAYDASGLYDASSASSSSPSSSCSSTTVVSTSSGGAPSSLLRWCNYEVSAADMVIDVAAWSDASSNSSTGSVEGGMTAGRKPLDHFLSPPSAFSKGHTSVLRPGLETKEGGTRKMAAVPQLTCLANEDATPKPVPTDIGPAGGPMMGPQTPMARPNIWHHANLKGDVNEGVPPTLPAAVEATEDEGVVGFKTSGSAESSLSSCISTTVTACGTSVAPAPPIEDGEAYISVGEYELNEEEDEEDEEETRTITHPQRGVAAKDDDGSLSERAARLATAVQVVTIQRQKLNATTTTTTTTAAAATSLSPATAPESSSLYPSAATEHAAPETLFTVPAGLAAPNSHTPIRRGPPQRDANATDTDEYAAWKEAMAETLRREVERMLIDKLSKKAMHYGGTSRSPFPLFSFFFTRLITLSQHIGSPPPSSVYPAYCLVIYLPFFPEFLSETMISTSTLDVFAYTYPGCEALPCSTTPAIA